MGRIPVKKYSLWLQSVLISLLLFFGCEKEYDTLIDAAGAAPFLSDAATTCASINTDTIDIGTVRSPNDLLTINGIATVRVSHPENQKNISLVQYSVSLPGSSSPIGEGTLHDDGLSPDKTANDSLFSGYINFQFYRVFAGKLYLSLVSKTRSNQTSNTLFIPLTIFRLNHPPVISHLDAPSIIYLSATSSFVIQVTCIDLDGQNDIVSVSRFTPSGKILPLHAINDSIYAEEVGLIPPPKLGSYEFFFRAADRSGDSSNVLSKTIVIAN